MKKLTFIVLTSLITSVFTSEVFAAELFNYPYVYKVFVERDSHPESCYEDAKTVYSKLEKENAIILFGTSGPFFFTEGSRCYSTVVFASKSKVSSNIFFDAFNEKLLRVDYVVNNEKATYMDYYASVFYEDGTFNECKKRDENLIKFDSWVDGYESLRGEVMPIQSLGLAGKVDWLADHFSCSLENVTKAEIVLDFANEKLCPLNYKTTKSCFIMRGLEKFKINLVK